MTCGTDLGIEQVTAEYFGWCVAADKIYLVNIKLFYIQVLKDANQLQILGS